MKSKLISSREHRDDRAAGLPAGRRTALMAAPLVAVSLMASPLHADSIWVNRTPQRAFLFKDLKAWNVGDVVTIVIGESTAVQNQENTALNKSGASNGAFDIETSASGGLGSQAAAGAFDLTNSSGREYQGGSKYTDARQFTDQISATVVDVLPNGNLVVSGERHIDVGGDRRTLKVSGIVRGFDIAPDNTISSRYVTQFQAIYEGSGQNRRFGRQGWWSRAMNVVWPF